ncbi:MAG: hotdog fold thioesterase [Deltaproteobacteria bacterium]|nr:hotdog fold thioesterase [Deltaproteobacteria bacterium]
MIPESIQAGMKNTLAETLGMEIVELIPKHVVMTMPVDARHHQPMGLLHGGVSVALAETVASVGGWFLVAEEGKVVVGQEINANHLRSVRSGKVKAIGECIHLGRTSQVWEIKIYDENEKMICISRCTLAVVDPLRKS